MKMIKEQFVEKSRKIHNDKYDYKLVDFINRYIRVRILCPIHGEFTQTPKHHLAGRNCPQCALQKSHQSRISTTASFIEKSKRVHNGKYKYSLTNYIHNKKKVMITCLLHGEFMQTPNAHLNGQGCPQCGVSKNTALHLISSEEFLDRSKAIHGDKYDYKLVEYKKMHERVNIICPKHGKFAQFPFNHLQGHGCSECITVPIVSKPHQRIVDYLSSLGIESTINNRKIIKPYEIDIFVPDKNLGIEMHGIYYHSYNHRESKEEKNAHYLKANMAQSQNITLLQIFEDEWNFQNDIVRSVICSKLGLNNKIQARKCEVSEICNDDYNRFCVTNHLQGTKFSSTRLGLLYNGEIVSIMSFNPRGGGYILERFCNKMGINVIGGASKLFKYFIRKFNPQSVFSYCDRRYSTGGLYRVLRMKQIGITPPNYFYVYRRRRHNRTLFQKHKLKHKLELFDPQKTEFENMLFNGYRRIWDAGHYKFLWQQK